MEDYLYKIARITGKSEYDVFIKSAEEWPITREKIDEDFKAYLMYQSVPYYVRDFIRKNKPHIDELSLPKFKERFYFNWYVLRNFPPKVKVGVE